MIDEYVEYKTINKYSVEISIVRQVQSNETILNKFELYSCIKDISIKELEALFINFYRDNSTKKYNLNISKENKEWLIEKVLSNLGTLFKESKDISNNYEYYLKNVLFILSLINISQEQLEKVMRIFLNIINKARNTIGIYESINQFLGIQHNLFETKIEDSQLIEFIEIIIQKLAYRTFNGYDYHAITGNYINNLYGYIKQSNITYDNYDLITRLLLEVKNLPIGEKINISKSLLLSIYNISSIEIQNDIKSFILNFNKDIDYSIDENLVFELLLIIEEFKEFKMDIVNKLSIFLQKYEDGKSFSSILYTLKYQIEYLVNKKSGNELEDILRKINDTIKNYENRKNLSIF